MLHLILLILFFVKDLNFADQIFLHEPQTGNPFGCRYKICR
jgi:hypothetical protein